MNGDLLDNIARLNLDSTSKGAAPENGAVLFSDVGKQGWNVLRGDLMFPVLTLHDDHLRTNLRLLRDFAEHFGVSLAPHGKTMMCPQIYRDCIETGGSWGITAATVQQAYVVAGSGVPNILIANEIVGPANVRQLVRLKRAYPRASVSTSWIPRRQCSISSGTENPSCPAGCGSRCFSRPGSREAAPAFGAWIRRDR